MEKYQSNVLNNTGSPVSGASVLVLDYPSGATATIFVDDGVTPAPNPLTTDDLGGFFFYAANGQYDLDISGFSIVAINITNVILFDPGDAGVGSVPSGTTAQRPVPPVLDQWYFDTTLGQPIICKQVSPPVWVNAAGVAV